jgi:adenylate kinase family enzyme
MNRICVVGSGGAGKTTFSRRLGELLGIEVIHLDALFWKPGWVQTPDDEFDEVVRRAAAGGSWIIDGNYGRTQPLRFPAADTIIFLDYPGWRCVARVLKRWWRHRGRSRPDMGPGCPESVDMEFIRWVWSFRRRSRPPLLARLDECRQEKSVIHLRSPREAERFLRRVARSDRGATS